MENNISQQLEDAYRHVVWMGEDEEDIPKFLSHMTGGKLSDSEIVDFLNSSRASEIVNELKAQALREIKIRVAWEVDHALAIGISDREDIRFYVSNSIGIDGCVVLVGGPNGVFDEIDLYLNSLKTE